MLDPAEKKKKKVVIAVIVLVGILIIAGAVILLAKAPAGETGTGSSADTETKGCGIPGNSEYGIGIEMTGADGTGTGETKETGQAEVESRPADTDLAFKGESVFAEKFRDAVPVTKEMNYDPAIKEEELTVLTENYPDVIGWLSIPGTAIADALFQSPTDDTLYLDHDRDRKASAAGELYTEHKYNQPDFTDPVTLVYGHNMRSGKKFGFLQEYYTGTMDKIGAAAAAKKYQTILVTLPQGELTYRVFAALPFDNRHILASYDFHSPLASYRFFSEVKKTRTIDGSNDRNVTIEEKDKVLILSTCMPDHNSRFLVMAKLVAAETKDE